MGFRLRAVLGKVEEEKGELFFSTPVGLDVKNGTLAVADLANNRVVLITENEVIKVGNYGTRALEFDLPIDVQFDNKGNLLVTEIGNHRVQKLSSELNFVNSWGGKGKIPGKFDIPNRIAVDEENNYYIVDEFNRRIQKFNEKGKLVLTFGRGYGKEGDKLSLPQGISYDRKRKSIWITDTYSHKVKMFSILGEFVKEFGKFGFNSGELNLPRGLYVDGDGYIYVADSYNHRVQKFDANGNLIYIIGGFPTLVYPVGVVKDGNRIFVSEAGNSRISVFEEFESSATIREFIGLPRNKNGQFSMPSGVAVDDEGNIYVSDTMNHRIQKFDRELRFLTKWGKNGGAGGWDGFGTSKGEFFAPSQLFFSDGKIYVADSMNCRIQIFTKDGEFVAAFGSPGQSNGQLMIPNGVAVDKKGNIYVSDTMNHRIQKFSPSLEHIATWGTFGKGDCEFNVPMQIAIDDENNLYIVDRNNNRIQKLDENGDLIAKWGSNNGEGCEDPLFEAGSGRGEFLFPAGICIWEEYVIVADWGNSRIQVFDRDGKYVTEFGELGGGKGAFFRPTGVSVDDEGRVFIADQLLNKVFVYEVCEL